MSAERGPVDDLAQLIRRVDGNHTMGAGRLAEEIVGAGYRKPRKVSTVEELDALPHHAMIYTADGDHAEHVYEHWFIPGVNYTYTSRTIALPATVTWEPTA